MARFTRAAADPKQSLEGTLTEAFPYLIDALGVSALGLLVPTSLSLGVRFGAQLVLLVLFGYLLAFKLLPFTDTIWFGGTSLRATQRVIGTGLALIVTVTGVVGLVTLASSAALRLQPSTQFLQLLSALDIAWAASTVMVSLYWLRGRVAALVGGAIVGLACIATIARYLDAVGFTPKGRWRLDAAALWKYILPYDIAVAIIAIAAFIFAVKRRAQLLSG